MQKKWFYYTISHENNECMSREEIDIDTEMTQNPHSEELNTKKKKK